MAVQGMAARDFRHEDANDNKIPDYEEQSENWNREGDSTVTLYTYTNAEEVELLINGQSQGRKRNQIAPKQRNRIQWKDIPYQEGKIEAVAYNNGKIVARHQLETTGEAVRLVAETDNPHWKADDELSFEVEGPARLIAVSNGDITSNELDVASHRHLWNGHALVILRAGREKGKVTLRIKSKYKTVTVQCQTS